MAEITKNANFTFVPTDPSNPNNNLNPVTIPVTYVIDSKTLESKVLLRGTDTEIGKINGYDSNTQTLDETIKTTNKLDTSQKVYDYIRENNLPGSTDLFSNREGRSFIEAGLNNPYFPQNGLPGAKKDIQKIIREEVKKGNSEIIEVSNKIKSSPDQATKDSGFVPPKEEVEQGDSESITRTISQNVGGAFDITQDLQTILSSAKTGNKLGVSEGSLLQYPLDMDISKQDYMKFYCCTFKPQMFEGFTFTDRDKKTCKEFGPVYLPVSGGAQDTNTVSWGRNEMNPLQIAAFGAARTLLQGDRKDITNYLEQGRRTLEQNIPSIKSATAAYFAEQASGVTGALSRTQGAVFNPNLVLLFNNPEMRSFTLNFKFSAREISEATSIRKIIRWFKQHMAVKRSKDNLFLLAPDIFSITYHMAGDGENAHKSIGNTKLCALTSCNVNYVPDNSYMTFNDESKTMTSYQMVLTFNEIEPLYQEDYTEAPDVISY